MTSGRRTLKVSAVSWVVASLVMQRGGKAPNRTGAVLEQDDARERGGHVRVPDGAEGFVEAGVDGGARRLAEPELFANAFELDDVGVDRHTDREHGSRACFTWARAARGSPLARGTGVLAR